MDNDRIEGSAKEIKGKTKEVAGKVVGDAKLESEGKADQVAGKIQNAVGGKLSAGPNGGVQTAPRRPARCLLDSCVEMIFKPNLDQLTVIADLSLARMRPDFIANRIGVPVGDFREWRQRIMAATPAERRAMAERVFEQSLQP
jgi:uncharacterized protein YjbJ (UPF0337 family)